MCLPLWRFRKIFDEASAHHPDVETSYNYGDETRLFQPAHGSAPDIMDMDRANTIAAI